MRQAAFGAALVACGDHSRSSEAADRAWLEIKHLAKTPQNDIALCKRAVEIVRNGEDPSDAEQPYWVPSAHICYHGALLVPKTHEMLPGWTVLIELTDQMLIRWDGRCDLYGKPVERDIGVIVNIVGRAKVRGEEIAQMVVDSLRKDAAR